MSHIAGHDRSQTLLLPESLDEYVGPENPVRFIEAFVDGLDLTAAGFVRVASKVTGPPGYAPEDLLKLYVYGYLNRVRSSRRLEAETRRNIEVIWLLRHLKPDFKTIAAAATTATRSVRCSASSFYSAVRWTCSAANCWPWTAPGSRRSTTRIATSPGRPCRSSSNWPTPSLTTICNGSTGGRPPRARRVARGSRTWPKRSPRSAPAGPDART